MIAVLRIGHRINRDQRMTTHVALVARAFGADAVYITTKDRKIEETVRAVSDRFGGNFVIETGVNQENVLNQWKGLIVHLTMYGDELERSIDKMDREKDVLVIVGSEKVPPRIYHRADLNVSVGNQPHSEVAALAMFLDRYTQGGWQRKQFEGKLEIVPSNRGKQVLTRENKESV